MCKLTFTKIISSELSCMKSAINELLDFICVKIPFISDKDYFDFKIIYNEIIANSIVHGNKKNKDKSVIIIIRIDDFNTIYSSILDEGSGIIHKTCTDYSSTLSENGRGLKLVRCLADKIKYYSKKGKVTFYKKVSLNAS